MGRWAQRRRRGSQGEPLGPTTVSIEAVVWQSDFQAIIFFTGVVTITPSTGVDNFIINGITPQDVAPNGTTAAFVDFGDPITIGDGWNVGGQPSWLAETLDAPFSGTVS
jgi:hypothetical protein